MSVGSAEMQYSLALPLLSRCPRRGRDHQGELAPGLVRAVVDQQLGGGPAPDLLVELGQLARGGHLPVAKEASQLGQGVQQAMG
jgi:hypothetical protein